MNPAVKVTLRCTDPDCRLHKAAGEGDVHTLDELRALGFRCALIAAGGNKTLVAKTLGIDRRTLYRELNRSGKQVERG